MTPPINRLELASTAPRTDRVSSGEESAQRQGIAASGNNLPAAKAATGKAEEVTTSKKELDRAVKDVSSFVQNLARDLNFRVDEDTEKFVVTVIDSTTGEVVRQIPTEEVMAISRQIAEIQDHSTMDGPRGILFQGDA